MPTARWALSTSVVDGKIYAIGGAGPVWQALRTVEEYDPATNAWGTKSKSTAENGP
jgi:N-acetylneuraminic acid mutarotase